jgi:hypothetical protein
MAGSRRLKPSEFWKNFRLGEELSISGTFLYNGVRGFHRLRKLDHSDELFEVLYNFAVGFERLLKIAVVLLEHDDFQDQEEFEKSLITHSHPNLLRRIKKHKKLKLAGPHNDFLELLARFYKQIRYGRFAISSVYDHNEEQREICNLLAKHLNVTFPEDSFFGIFNDDRYKKFIRSMATKIGGSIYAVISERAHELGLYTYELRSGSKAETVFLGKADIPSEEILWKELLIFFMNTKATNGYLKFLRETPALEFDPSDVPDYLDCFQSDSAKALVMDHLEHLYEEEVSDKAERLNRMSIIGNPNVDFSADDEDDEDD